MVKGKSILQLTSIILVTLGIYVGGKALSVGTTVTPNYTLRTRNLWPMGIVEFYKHKDGTEELYFNRFKNKTRYINSSGDDMPERISITTTPEGYSLPKTTTFTFSEHYSTKKKLFDEGKKLITLEKRLKN